jgi:hypothetical protein
VPGSLVGVIATFDEGLQMAFPASLTRRPRQARSRAVAARLIALVQAPSLDADLGAGIRPSVSPAHQLRADHLRRRDVRRRIATALNGAVEDVGSPVHHVTAQAPLDREAVRSCQRQIRDLATLVSTMDNPRIQGVAIAFQLAFDGSGAMFFHPDTPNGIERLANTVNAAHGALRVSADFDEP